MPLAYTVTAPFLLAGLLFTLGSCLPAPGLDAVPGPASTGIDQTRTAQAVRPVQPVQRKGFIRVGPTRRYFQHEDGTPFVPIGHNEWTGALTGSAGEPDPVDAYMQNMRDSGANVLRIILDGKGLYVEDPAGVFNPELKRFMDRLVRAAEKNGIYLQVVMWHNVFNVPKRLCLWSCWAEHPYNKANGGPIEKFEDLFTSPVAMKLQEARIRFFVDNWGMSDHIFAWELANEFNRVNDRWIQHMAAYLKNYEVSKIGKSHLRSISVSHSDFGGPENAQWSCPDLDFATFHTYGKNDFRSIRGSGVARLEKEPFVVPDIVARVRNRAKDRPLFDSEIPGVVHGGRKVVLGLGMLGVRDEVLFESFLTVGWAYLCSGAAGPGLRWASNPSFQVHGRSNALHPTMYGYHAALRRFSDEVDWNRMEGVPHTAIRVLAADNKQLRAVCTGSGDRRYLVGWVFDQLATTASGTSQVTVTFSKMPKGPHRVRWFEGTTGREIKKERTAGSSFSVTSPPFLGHAAFTVDPER